MDINDPTKNEYSDIYSLYGENGSYETGVLSLDGGDGDNCATSNFCKISKELLSNEKSDQQVNSIKQDSKVLNKQSQSHNVDISFINKKIKKKKQPLLKYLLISIILNVREMILIFIKFMGIKQRSLLKPKLILTY